MSAAIIFTFGAMTAWVSLVLALALRRNRRGPAEPDFNWIASVSTDDGIVVQRLDGTIIWANPAYLRIVGLPLGRIVGRNPLSFCMQPTETLSQSDIAAFRYDPDDPNWRKLMLRRNRRSDGALFWNQMSHSFHHQPDGETFVVLVCRDVSEQVEREDALRETTAKLAYVADHDALTGVANRNRFASFIQTSLADAALQGRNLGLLQIDLDKFKSINDHHGHAAGDAALQHVAEKMSRNLRRTDLLARLGGDEFVAVCPGVEDDTELLRIGHALCDAVRAPLQFEGKELNLSISVGAVVAGTHDTDAENLLQKSDFALYEVKRNGRGHVAVYNSGLHAEMQRKDRLSAQLREAIEADNLTFYFQPTIDLITGGVRGFEALARWQHPIHGLVHPSVFLPFAREMNLMRLVDHCALSAAARFRTMLTARGYSDIRVGINASENILDDEHHAASLRTSIGRFGVSPHELVLEMPEREMLRDPDQLETNITAISRLSEAGFNIVIDGFGAGYAGLLHLDRLALAGFKIDKSLIRHLDCTPACSRIAAMLIQFGQEKNLFSVSCGIETARQLELVRAMGGKIVQGNYFARPMPQEDTMAWLCNREARQPLNAVI